jgi:hypothetical protein
MKFDDLNWWLMNRSDFVADTDSAHNMIDVEIDDNNILGILQYFYLSLPSYKNVKYYFESFIKPLTLHILNKMPSKISFVSGIIRKYAIICTNPSNFHDLDKSVINVYAYDFLREIIRTKYPTWTFDYNEFIKAYNALPVAEQYLAYRVMNKDVRLIKDIN